LLDSGVSVAYHIVSKDKNDIRKAWRYFTTSLESTSGDLSALRSAFAGAIEGMGQSLPEEFILRVTNVVRVGSKSAVVLSCCVCGDCQLVVVD
jgi:hypothetical protein